MKRLAILGITGSIGTQTVNVVREHFNNYKIEAFSVGYSNEEDQTIKLIEEFQPKIVSTVEKDFALMLSKKFPNIKFVYGEEGLNLIAQTECELVVNSVVGSVGLMPTITAIRNGTDVALANKETIVVAGDLIKQELKVNDVKLFPIDSEHSAILQCLNGEKTSEINKIILTASGGSFRDKTREELENVTVEDALNHPNWSMGSKITIDSATMVNKGLEIIEAYHLFDVDVNQIDVVIHLESIIHSMVEFKDKSVMAQLGLSDMTIPISYALSYPNRLPSDKQSLDLAVISSLNFRKMDFERYPCVKMAYEALKIGHTMPLVYNASNEVAVAEFLAGNIKFLDIELIIKAMMDNHTVLKNLTIEEILELDKEIKNKTRELIKWDQY